MSLLNTLRFITSHPLTYQNKLQAIARFIKWQIKSRINADPILYPYVENTFLLVERGMTGATGNLYVGLHEFESMSFLLHTLKKEDLFIDVGANIGSYTVLAAGVKGAKTIAIEPSSCAFTKLLQNIKVNSIEQEVTALKIGLGSTSGKLFLSRSLDSINHIMLKSQVTSSEYEEVQMEVLDSYISSFNDPTIVKIDVEGYETEVLRGASAALNNQSLKAVLIETNGSGSRYGFDDKDIHEYLIKHNFLPYSYDPIRRKLKEASKGLINTIYIRDFAFVVERIKRGNKVTVLGKTF